MPTAPLTFTATIATYDVERFEANLRPFARKLDLTWEVSPPRVVRQYREGQAKGWDEVVIDYQLTAPSLRTVPGFAFAAKISHNEPGEGFNLVETPNGGEVEARWSTAPAHCAHCATDRRRKTTYLVSDASGEVRQVGSTCLDDFTGLPLHKLLVAWQFQEFLERPAGGGDGYDLGSFGGYRPGTANLKAVLVVALASASLYGYVSAKAARESYGSTSTADEVRAILFGRGSDRSVSAMLGDDEGGTLEAGADALIEWARAEFPLPAPGEDFDPRTTGYARNMAIAFAGDDTPPKILGLVVSAIGAKAASDAKAARAKADAERAIPTTPYLADVGAKVKGVPVTILSTFEKEGIYGITTIVKLRSSSGHDIVWFASGIKASLEPGQTYTMAATVKNHKTFREQPETQVTRARLT